MPFSGGCLCGAIRYESASKPVFQLYCHCRDCQRVTGSACAPILFFRSSDLKVTGDVKTFASLGGSGKTIRRGFCPTCGSHLFGELEAQPGLLSIRAGTLDDPAQFAPKLHIYTSQAAPWDAIDPSLPAFPTAYTPPPSKAP